MIHVEDSDVKVGNATGAQLIEEASKAVYGVFLTLKQDMPENISEHDLMVYLLTNVGRNLAHMGGAFKTEKILEGKPDNPEDFMNKVFGDLFKQGE